MKPTKEQFIEYVKIRNSGMTNMWDIRFITSISETGISDKNCFYIMNHFNELAKEYGMRV